jgi:RNA binding exosome subunit
MLQKKILEVIIQACKTSDKPLTEVFEKYNEEDRNKLLDLLQSGSDEYNSLKSAIDSLN